MKKLARLFQSQTAPKTPQRHARPRQLRHPDIMHSGEIMSPRFLSDDMLGGGYGAAPATSYTATKTAPPWYHARPHRVPRSRPATRSAGAPPWREAARRGITPWREARRGPATSYTATSTVLPGIMHDGIVRRGPARRHARRWLHRGVKQRGATPWRAARRGGAAPWREQLGVGAHRGVQLGVGPHRGVHQLGVGRQRA